MTFQPLDDDLAVEAVELFKKFGSQVKVAAALGCSRSSVQRRLQRAARKGLLGYSPPLEGFSISKITTTPKGDYIQQKPEHGDAFEVPAGHLVKGVSALIDAEGKTIQQWVKTKQGELSPEGISEKIRLAFEGMNFTAPIVPGPASFKKDCLSLFCFPDAHMGMYVWGEEASENWGLKKADRVYRAAFAQVVSMTPASSEAIFLAGGDQMHADNSENRTAKSGNNLDVDGRYDRVLITTCEMFLSFICLLLQKHDKVTVRILKGNHDPHASAAIAYFLLASFRDEPRVNVDVSPSLFWTRQFGSVMLSATHGHQAKPQDLPGIMAGRWPQIWGDTKFRYGHTFHVHHRSKFASEERAVIVETHHSPAPQDAWHWGEGFLSGRSLRSIVYHKDLGEHGGATWPVMPEE